MRDTPLVLEAKLRKWQQLFWLTMGKRNICLLHRSAGKTELVCILAATSLLSAKVALPLAIYAPSLKKARKLAFSKVREYLESKQTGYLKFLKSDGQIINERSGATLDFYSLGTDGNADMSRGARNAQVFADEIDELDVEAFGSVLLPTMQGLKPELQPFKMFIGIGTARGSASLLTQLIAKHQPLSPTGLSDVHVDETDPTPLSIPPELTAACSKSDYRFYHFPVTKTKLISDEELDGEQVLLSKSQYSREYLCNLEAVADTTLFPLSALIRCAQESYEPDQFGHIKGIDRDPYNDAPVVAGLDIAGSGKDAMILFIRQGLSRPLFLGEIPTGDGQGLNRLNMEKAISKIQSLLDQYLCDHIAVDAGGLGTYFYERMVDRLSPYHINCYAVQGQEKTPRDWENSYYNMRSCLIGLCSLAVREGFALPKVPELIEELQAHKSDAQKQDSRMKAEGKDKVKALIGRSPDTADAVFLSFYFESQDPDDKFLIDLRSIARGRVQLSNAELLDRYPEFYEQENNDAGLFEGSLLDNQGDQYDHYDSDTAWGKSRY